MSQARSKRGGSGRRRAPGTESDRKRGVGAFLVVAAGVVAGAALEEYVYRRAFRRRADPEAAEPIGGLSGE